MINIEEITQQQINDGLIKVKQIIADNPNRICMNAVVSKSVPNINICNTPLCIGGWLANVIGHEVSGVAIVKDYISLNNGPFELNKLFNKYSIDYPTVEQTHDAIDAYLSGNITNPWEGIE